MTIIVDMISHMNWMIWYERYEWYDINWSHISDEERKIVKNLLINYRDIFSENPV